MRRSPTCRSGASSGRTISWPTSPCPTDGSSTTTSRNGAEAQPRLGRHSGIGSKLVGIHQSRHGLVATTPTHGRWSGDAHDQPVNAITYVRTSSHTGVTHWLFGGRDHELGGVSRMTDITAPLPGVTPTKTDKPKLDNPSSPIAAIIFFGFLAAGVLFMGYSLYDDVAQSGMKTTTILPYLLLFVALLIALGFEFVNG